MTTRQFANGIEAGNSGASFVTCAGNKSSDSASIRSIERVMILEDSDLITADWLPRRLISDERTRSSILAGAALQAAEVAVPSFRSPNGGINLEQVELTLVRQAMERSGGNQTRASELLGISRDQLRYRLKKIEESQPEQ